MRKKIWWLAVIVLLMVTGICVVNLQDNEEEIIVTEEYHQRDEVCGASFRMWSIRKDGMQYGFDQACFTEDDAVKYVSELGQCINVIRKRMKNADAFLQNMELQVLVLNDISTVTLPKTDDVLILSKDELESGQYMFPLFLSICHLDENSQNFGAYEYIFEIEYSNEMIKEYLSDEKNQQVLDLFYPRKSEKYSNKKDVEMFGQILASLAAEMIGEIGLERYLMEPLTENSVNDWLGKIGLAYKYDNDNWDYINQLEFKKDSRYDFNIKCGNVEYLVKDCESVFESVSDIKEFLVYEMKTRDAIGEYLKDNNIKSPMFDDAFQLNYEIRCGLPARSYTYSGDDDSASIHIYDVHGLLQEVMTHELVHAYVRVIDDDKVWMNEGFAEYFSKVVFPQDSRKEAFYNAVSSALPGEEGIWEKYVKMKGLPEKIEDFDMAGFIDGCLVSYWDGDETLQVPIMTEKIWQSDHVDQSACGAELNYWEAESFVAYLIGQSSFEATWNCMINDIDFGATYGKSYNKLKKEWIQSLRADL